MIYATCCSGIDAPGVAWKTLGWRAAFHSEIEPFPCDVLAAREPDVPNLGNMEAITREQIEGFKPVSVFVAGTPCQSFSVAGLRRGMADPRGNLALVFLRLVDWLRPAWVVWENVPGVLSSDDGRAFGAFLGGLGQLGYGFAYRVLDAQHFGVPQRRRRVFVVGHLGDWRRAAAVLFERHGLSGNPAPSREAGARTAACLTRGADSSGKGGYAGRRGEDDYNIVNALDTFQGGPDDNSAQAGHLVCGTLNANGKAAGSATQQDAESGLLIAQTLMGRSNPSFDPTMENYVCHSLRADGFDASEDGTGRGTPLVAIQGTMIGRSDDAGPCGPGYIDDGSMFTLTKSDRHGVAKHSGVRRLLPVECERLQGFPDSHTAVKHRSKPAADAPRYKAIGNSMAVPVLLWIGRRIEAVEALPSPTRKAPVTT